MTGYFVPSGEGRGFVFDTDTVTVKRSASAHGGGHSILHWVAGVECQVPRHRHAAYEETFFVLEGEIEFLVGGRIFKAKAGDFVQVPPGTEHAFRNTCGKPVSMIITFNPGGIEELFYAYRKDGGEPDFKTYADRARQEHNTGYDFRPW